MAAPRTKPATGLLSRGSVPTSLILSTVKAQASPHTRDSYARGIARLLAFLDGRGLTLALLQEWRLEMMRELSASTVNQRISAARALIRQANRAGLIDQAEAWELLQIEGVPMRGVRNGNWLTLDQLRRLLAVPTKKNLRGARNYCILALLAGCALRLDELTTLEVATLQQREGRWVLIDLVGKGGRVRTVAVPGWVKAAIDNWIRQAKITEGRLIRQLTLKPEGMSSHGIREIVQKAAALIGVKGFSPHDLRRTCAKLCREAGGDVEQIQAMLGHASMNTTQRYLGTTQNLRYAVNDNMGL
jgi:integrase